MELRKAKRRPDPFVFELEPPPDDMPAVLMEAFAFSAHDLLCNQAGELSKAQRQRLERRTRLETLQWGAVAGVLALFVIILLAAFANDPPRLFSVEVALGLLALVGFGALLVTVLVAGWTQRARFARDLAVGRVEAAAGPVRLQIARRGRSGVTIGQLTIGVNTFEVPEQAVLKLHDGEALCLYYTPETRLALSAEPLD